MKFGKPLDYSMMLTAPLRESLHWKSYKMPRPDQPDGLRRMPGPVAGLHGDRVGEPRHQAGPSVGRARTTSCSTSRPPGPANPEMPASKMLPRVILPKLESRGQSALAAVRGGADNFTLFTEMIAEERNAGDRCDGKGKDQGVRWTGCWVSSTSRSHIC